MEEILDRPWHFYLHLGFNEIFADAFESTV